MALNARNKGHAYERKIVNELKEYLLFVNALSSRSESKNLDDKGVDIAYTDPFYIQCKAVEKLGNITRFFLRCLMKINIMSFSIRETIRVKL